MSLPEPTGISNNSSLASRKIPLNRPYLALTVVASPQSTIHLSNYPLNFPPLLPLTTAVITPETTMKTLILVLPSLLPLQYLLPPTSLLLSSQA